MGAAISEHVEGPGTDHRANTSMMLLCLDDFATCLVFKFLIKFCGVDLSMHAWTQ